MKKNLPVITLFSTLIFSIILNIYFYFVLPDRVAIHFGFSGNADGFSSKTFSAIFNIGIIVFITALFMGIRWSLSKVPDSMLNIPNKEYWLTPERRDFTLIYNGDLLIWIGATTNIFLILISLLVNWANINGQDSIGAEFWILLIIYLFLIFFAVYKMYSKFNKIPGNENQ